MKTLHQLETQFGGRFTFAPMTCGGKRGLLIHDTKKKKQRAFIPQAPGALVEEVERELDNYITNEGLK